LNGLGSGMPHPSIGVMAAKLKRRPRAGRYVDAWYLRAYRPWRRQTRIAFAIVAPVVGALTMLPTLIWPTWWQFYAGCALGSLAALYTCLLGAPPEWIARKRRGRDAERRTEKQLRPLERRGWRAVHDIAQPRGNFDHVLAGPGGVFLLETKTFTGQATLSDNGRLVITRGTDERDRWTPVPPIGPTVKRAAFDLREDLVRRTGIRWVQGVVVLWSDFPGGEATRSGIVYIHGTKLRAWLERQRTELTRGEVARASDYLDLLDKTPFGPQPTHRQTDAWRRILKPRDEHA
jgi:hypothetical protein